ncbi:hypothetical protein COD86_31030 [Bacillus cereus]|nr:hypothetical protein COD14_31885 [Bacillus cereus]PGV84959.1 hypothetical protein COD86_31030 [Bacillus cereus]
MKIGVLVANTHDSELADEFREALKDVRSYEEKHGPEIATVTVKFVLDMVFNPSFDPVEIINRIDGYIKKFPDPATKKFLEKVKRLHEIHLEAWENRS